MNNLFVSIRFGADTSGNNTAEAMAGLEPPRQPENSTVSTFPQKPSLAIPGEDNNGDLTPFLD